MVAYLTVRSLSESATRGRQSGGPFFGLGYGVWRLHFLCALRGSMPRLPDLRTAVVWSRAIV